MAFRGLEARGAAKPPTMHRAAPATQNDQSQVAMVLWLRTTAFSHQLHEDRGFLSLLCPSAWSLASSRCSMDMFT